MFLKWKIFFLLLLSDRTLEAARGQNIWINIESMAGQGEATRDADRAERERERGQQRAMDTLQPTQ